MRLAVMSDVHANLEALEAVLADIETRHVDAVCCLGDVVGYGADPIPCLELINQTCDIKLLGNHEYTALGRLPQQTLNAVARASAEWTQVQLGDRAFQIIAEFTMNASREGSHFVHASPCEPDKWHYILTTAEADRAFKHMRENICFVGHTHLPAIITQSPAGKHRQQVGHDFDPDPDSRYLVNVGSVGQPRDRDPRACYVTFDSGEQEVLYHRVEYDITRAQQKMRHADLPALLIDRLQAGK